MAETSSGSKKSKLLIIIGVVLVLVGSGVAAYFIAPQFMGETDKSETSKKGEEVASEGAEVKKESQAEVESVVAMKPMVVNVQGGGGRFLKVNIELKTGNKDAATEILKRMGQVRDQLISTLTTKRANEISTVEGKRKLKQEIIRKTNRIIKSGKVKKVFFTDFVMQ